MRRINGRGLSNVQFEKFRVLDSHDKLEDVESMLVNIPTIVTGFNEDGTLSEEEIKSYASEIVVQNKKFID
ncbi:MAG TPA: hypothetical protein VIM70_15445 [Clostridium sp.]|uniref:hypothetical protein n=1 Tax=Clostridium sp. TaxID=1506 RepID=UPI002F934C3B